MKPTAKMGRRVAPNRTFTGPDCDPLPAYVERQEDRVVIVSCWSMTLIERIIAFVTGRVFLYVRGGQPPVLLAVRESDIFGKTGGERNVVGDR